MSPVYNMSLTKQFV